MRRIALRTGPAALFGGALLLALLTFLPMRLALGWVGLSDQGLSARSVSGTVWGGRLTEARFGDLALGDLSARLSPLPLLLGTARIVLAGPERAAAPIRGAISLSRHAIGVERASGSVATGGVFAPLPVTGLDLTDLSVRFRDGRCDAAEGQVRATLGGAAAGLPLPPFVAGPARCDRGALLLPLASPAGTEAVALRIEGDGRYHADFSVRPADPAAGARLERTGFIAGPDGYRLSVEGRF